MTHTSEAAGASPCSPGLEISFGGYQATLQRWKSVCGPNAGGKSLKWPRRKVLRGSLKLARLGGWNLLGGRGDLPPPNSSSKVVA